MFKKFILFALMIALTVAVVGCSDDDDNTDPMTSGNTLTLDLTGLEPLANGFHYEGWAIVDGQPVSTGKFNIDANGALVDLDGNAIANNEFTVSEDIGMASAVVLTIEPDGDSDPAPAETHYIAGDVSHGMADLSIGHGAALGDDFMSAMGRYILATPTNGANTNENSGIWFLELSTTLALNFDGLTPLANGFHYEGWAIVDDAPISTGKFNVDENGNLIDMDGNMFANNEMTVDRDLSGATAFVLTIEPANDSDPAPAATHYLAGDINNMMADLSIGHGAAIGSDFMDASGDYILATPTNGADTNENSGIWFLDLSSGSPMQGLDLPTLPAGWEYEGWVVIDGQPVTTGRFTDAMMADDSAPFSGDMAGPPFPGEDFLMNAPAGLSFPTDIAGGMAVISVEPMPDDSDAPFALKPLLSMIPADATDHTTYMLDKNVTDVASGSVTLTVGPAAGMSLPSLPAGWQYEGWVVIDGQPVTTGRFTDVAMADMSAPFSGNMAGPPFPGEDFLTNAPAGLSFPTDIAGGMAVISVEPMPDDSDAPFTLKPLAGMIPADAGDHITYDMDNNTSSLPAGTATIE